MKEFHLSLRALSAAGGAEVHGIDLRDELSREVQDALRGAWREHGMLLFRDQEIGEADQTRFGEIFGPISQRTVEEYSPKKNGFDFISNVSQGGRNPHGALGFHTECSFFEHPLAALMLYALEAPPEGTGGETLFCNLALAYQALPAPLKARIATLRVRHGYPDFRKGVALPGVLPDARAPRSEHPLVFPHPATGKPLLFLSRRHVDCILDLTPEESSALIDELYGYIGRPDNTFAHAWRTGDLVIWDNYLLQHGRNDFDPSQRRHLRRLQVAYA